jgi:hypothetical protein
MKTNSLTNNSFTTTYKYAGSNKQNSEKKGAETNFIA